MAMDFYLRLGVNRKADAESIKRAYRKIAKSCHPDMEGECGDADRFRDLQEAYETLSDTDKRKAYDERLTREEDVSVPVHRREPFDPGTDPSPGPSRGYRGDPRPRRRSDPFAAFSGGMDFPFHGTDTVHLEAILSPEEASEGGTCELPVEIASPCPWCEGAVPSFRFHRRCAACGGAGRIRQRRHLPFHIPAGIRHGAILTLDDPALAGSRVRVRILIDG